MKHGSGYMKTTRKKYIAQLEAKCTRCGLEIMARYSAVEVAGMMAESDLESGSSGSEVAEDPSFPLPREDSDWESDTCSSTSDRASPTRSPLPPLTGLSSDWSQSTG